LHTFLIIQQKFLYHKTLKTAYYENYFQKKQAAAQLRHKFLIEDIDESPG